MDRPVTETAIEGISLPYLIALQYQTIASRDLGARGLTGLPGKVASRQRGNGLDFDDLRRYHPGDDVRHMDWNVTARTRKPHIRLYREDRERTVTVAIDLRPNMFTGSQQLRADIACELGAIALWQASRNGDRCAAVVYDHSGIHASRPRIAQRGVLEALKLIAGHYEIAKAARRESDDGPLDAYLTYLNSTGRLSGAVLLFSGLDIRGPRFADEIRIAASQGRMAYVVISDPIETDALPPGRYPFIHGQKQQSAQLSTSSVKRAQDHLKRQRREKLSPLQQYQLPLLDPLSTDTPRRSMLLELNRRGFL